MRMFDRVNSRKFGYSWKSHQSVSGSDIAVWPNQDYRELIWLSQGFARQRWYSASWREEVEHAHWRFSLPAGLTSASASVKDNGDNGIDF